MDERNMRHDRGAPAKRLIDLHLARRVGEMIVAANDMGDAHIMIIHNHGEHIGRRTIRTQKNDVVEILVCPGDPTLDFVVENRFALAGSLEPDSRFYVWRGFGGGGGAPPPGLAR